MGELRFGLAFDSHPRDDSRPCLIGGVLFEGEPGLAGHSDADVLCHAVADALLGAAGLGDLGQHFPDTDPRFGDMAGLDLLARAVEMVRERDLVPTACDATLLAERPAIAPRRDEIRANLARILGVERFRVSVKATRPEGLGFTGDGAGCFAFAVLETR